MIEALICGVASVVPGSEVEDVEFIALETIAKKVVLKVDEFRSCAFVLGDVAVTSFERFVVVLNEVELKRVS